MNCTNCGEKINEGVNYCASCGSGTESLIQVASWSKRLLHYFIDIIVITILQVIFAILVGGALTGLIIFILYYLILESTTQVTVGKLITGTKVVRRDGGKPNFVQVLGRTFSRFIPFEALSFVVNSNPVGWHDRFPKTYVVSDKYTKEEIKSIVPKKSKINAIVIIVIILAVIFIIGILASVILTSLNQARIKGSDAAVKASLASVRAEAQIFYGNNFNTYDGICSDTTFTNGVTTAGSAGGGTPVCNDSADAWAVSSPLRSSGHWCVDSSGNIGEVKYALLPGSVNCPEF